MKKLLILPILLILIMSCSKNSTSDVAPDYTNNHPSLIGKWQYVLYLEDTQPNSNPILNGYTITFNNNGTFVSNEFADYPSGNYMVSSTNNITLNYTSTTNGNFTKSKEIGVVSSTVLTLYRPSSNYNSGEKFTKITTP